MALFSRKNISKLKSLEEIIEKGGCILIHDYKKAEEIIIYDYSEKYFKKIYKSRRYNTWDSNLTEKWSSFSINEYISDKTDLYEIEGYESDKTWLVLENLIYDVIIEQPFSFKPVDYLKEALKKYNMTLCPITI